jgi:hypothetical protein
MTNEFKCNIEFYNNNHAKYAITTNIQIFKCIKDEHIIKIVFPSKEDVINFEFDTLEEDIFINININTIDIQLKNKNDLRLNCLIEKYRRKLAYKIKWDLKTNKKKIKVKALYINNVDNDYIYEILEKYAVISIN